ncbi:hypothetical protein LV779_28055 [Streptomyces thinghirensis]|nr:hypothetical protein [Streptomyces thinghirensis]
MVASSGPACPPTVPGVTVNRLCASGLEAVVQAASRHRRRRRSIALAGGVESMTRAPRPGLGRTGSFPAGHTELYSTTLGWRRMVNLEDGPAVDDPLGESAELMRLQAIRSPARRVRPSPPTIASPAPRPTACSDGELARPGAAAQGRPGRLRHRRVA